MARLPDHSYKSGEESFLLRLSHIEDLFPAEWRAFSPSPRVRYIETIRQELISFGVLPAEGDPSFDGFCNVPRYFHPAASEEALALSLELICWYFYFDDPFDDGVVREGATVVERMLTALDPNKRFPSNLQPVEKLCRQFQRRAALLSGSRELYERFLLRCAEWVRSILPITQRRSEPVGLDEYDGLRLVNVGILPEYTLNEMFGELRLTQTFLALPAVQRLGELAALIIAYCNDVYSYEREARRKTQLNSLEIRRATERCSLATAYEGQLERLRAMIAEFVSIQARLEHEGVVGWSSPDDTIATARKRRQQTRYVEDMIAIVVGNHYWSLADGRYASPRSPFEELRTTPARRPRAIRKAAGT